MSGRGHVATWVLGVALIASCERSGPGHPAASISTTPADLRDAATSAPVDAGAAGMSVQPVRPADAGPAAGSTQDIPWRKALDEVVRRIDRGDPPARVAAVFGRVSTDKWGLRVDSLPSWTSLVEVSANNKTIEIALTLTQPLPVSELEAGAGPCEVALMGEFGDGLRLVCSVVRTRRGIMEVGAFTRRSPDTSLVDLIMFDWRPTAPPVDKPRGR